MGLDAGGVDADNSSALGVDAEHIDGVLLDRSVHCLGIQAVQCRALGILFGVNKKLGLQGRKILTKGEKEVIAPAR